MKFIARKSFGGTSSSQQATFIAAESFNHEIYDVALAAANFLQPPAASVRLFIELSRAQPRAEANDIEIGRCMVM